MPEEKDDLFEEDLARNIEIVGLGILNNKKVCDLEFILTGNERY